MRSFPLCCAAAVLVLSACSGGPTSTANAPTGTATRTAAAAVSPAPKELGTIKASGFGQNGDYVWVTGVVHNNSSLVGQTATVNFNVLDDKGELLKSESQVESFYQPDADHAVGTQVTLEPGQKAAKVEATVDVEASGAFSDKPFPTLPTAKMSVGKDEYGQSRASFELSNPLTVALKSHRIGVVCTNTAGTIIGGSSAYPDLVAPSGKVKVEANLIVSGEPARCSVYAGPPTGWDGEGLGASAGGQASAAPTAASGSAEAAFKTWVDQFNAKDWTAQYDTLVSAQKAVISKAQYVACRSKETAPKFSWVKVLAVTDAGATTIPGTKAQLPSTQVRVQVAVQGIKTPVDAHMYQENGQWRWSMTQQNLDNCA